MSKRTLFEISYDEVEGVYMEEHIDLRLSREDIDAKVLNALAMSLGAKVDSMFKSDEVKVIMLDRLIGLVKSNAFRKA